MSKYIKLLQSGKNIFTTDDLSSIWGQNKRSDTVLSADWYVRTGKLHRIRRGVYAINRNDLEPFVLANKLFAPSYVSGFTILIKHGLSFQVSHAVHSVALKTREVQIDNVDFVYHAIKPSVFYNDTGIVCDGSVTEASLERAIADTIYLSGGKFEFEDYRYMKRVDWRKLQKIGRIYGKKSVIENIKKLKEGYDAFDSAT